MAKACAHLAVVILAAGDGTRMRSDLTKVLHPLAGRPLLSYPLAAAEALEPERLLVVVGREGKAIREAFAGRAEFIVQEQPRGSGDAALAAKRVLRGFRGTVLIINGDAPLVRAASLRALCHAVEQSGAQCMLLSAALPLPGRVVRDAAGRVTRIIETPDATPEELELEEGNAGAYAVDAPSLWEALGEIRDDNAQGELYLTDVVRYGVARDWKIDALRLGDPEEALGVNTRAELARAAAVQRRRNAERLMEAGVTVIDPLTTYLDSGVRVGRDTVIEPGCVLQGMTRIGAHCHIKAHTVIEDSRLDDDVTVGPCAHLRPGTHLAPGVRVGNFVEIKNSRIGSGVKADHLSYIGDADVAAGASFGCGSVVVNYDGFRKHRTRVGADAFVGCQVNLIAPLTVGAEAFIAAGSTVTDDVPPGALAVARQRQRNISGWRNRRRARDGAEEE